LAADSAVATDGALAPDSTLTTDSAVTMDAATTDAAGTNALDALLAALRTDLGAAMQAQSDATGWPAPVPGGWLVVSTTPGLCRVAGDHDAWQGTPMTTDIGFCWLVLAGPADDRYKFTDLTNWQADPWSRAYEHDSFGVMSRLPPSGAHLERFFNVQGQGLAPRTVRVWVPAAAATHVLYVHDGQNLFDPDAMWGGWQLDASAPAGMMLVGIDNTGAARMDEYTHVSDDLGEVVGGHGDAYADLVNGTVRDLIATHYGEAPVVGVMGSSLGGLIAFHIALRHPGAYDFAASLSGTMGWGSIGDGVHNATMIERYAAAGHGSTALYLDSGGNGSSCADSDGDGIHDDDPSAADNYCENVQLRDVLLGLGYTSGGDLWYWHEADAAHNEAAWAARVWRPLGLLADR
jgi:predicted alpha/beta superfamily hydrolase